MLGGPKAFLLRNLKHPRVGTDAVNDARVQRRVSAERGSKLITGTEFRVQSLFEPYTKRQTGWDSPISHSQRAAKETTRRQRLRGVALGTRPCRHVWVQGRAHRLHPRRTAPCLPLMSECGRPELSAFRARRTEGRCPQGRPTRCDTRGRHGRRPNKPIACSPQRGVA